MTTATPPARVGFVRRHKGRHRAPGLSRGTDAGARWL